MTVVCAKHFPSNFQVVKVKGRERPRDPPSVFELLPKSLVPTPPPAKRRTTKAESSVRSVKEDELSKFVELDNIDSFEIFCNSLSQGRLNDSIFYYTCLNRCCIQSKEHENKSGINKFCLIVFNDLSYEAYHAGVRCTVTLLVKNRIHKFKCWSQVHEALQYLTSFEKSEKKTILLQQVECMSNMNSSNILEQKYSPEVIIRAFEYFALSRSLYNQLRNDFQLPSIATLTHITSKTSNIDDNAFICSIFSKLNNGQKQCILLIYEVYIKPMLTYHGGQLFGKAVNDESNLAKTVLAFMIICFYGGPKFLIKMLPVNNLDSDFLYDQTIILIDQIKKAKGKVIAIINDNNRVNQAFFKRFDCLYPWLTTDGIFLLFDFVHLLKCIRNNWIAEKSGEIEFSYSGKTYTAKWDHIKKLQKLEDGELVKMSKLTYVAANPRPIERQNVNTCLKVFCEETINALKCHQGMKDDDIEGTIVFLTKVVQFWKIVNVKSPSEGIHLKDHLRDPISSVDDLRLNDLIEFSGMLKSTMIQGKRIKSITMDTSNALYQTCNGLVELSKHLLNNSHMYVLLGNFTTDPIERAFGKLRQGSGGTYFINTQQVIEKWNISKTKLVLQKFINISSVAVLSGHACDGCFHKLSEDECEMFNHLHELLDQLPFDIKSSIVYIAGYVSRNKNEGDDDTFLHYGTYGNFTSALDRGGLKIPNDTYCEWVFLSYVSTSSFCRYSMSCLFMDIACTYDFTKITRNHCHILTNILFNNYCYIHSPASDKETKVKAYNCYVSFC